MIEGAQIAIGGKKFTVPPLGVAGLKKWTSLQSAYAEMSDEEQLDATIKIIHAALVRNYPELTLEEIMESVHAWEIVELSRVLPALFEKGALKSLGETRRRTKAS
jgi:hypothetical protein